MSGTTSDAPGLGYQGTLVCPSGEKVVGGGWTTTPAAAVPSNSGPSSDGTSWTGALANTTDQTIVITFSAVCVDVSGSAAPTSAAGATRTRIVSPAQVFTLRSH